MHTVLTLSSLLLHTCTVCIIIEEYVDFKYLSLWLTTLITILQIDDGRSKGDFSINHWPLFHCRIGYVPVQGTVQMTHKYYWFHNHVFLLYLIYIYKIRKAPFHHTYIIISVSNPACNLLPCGLVARIPGFHPGGPGSIPGMGRGFNSWMPRRYYERKGIRQKIKEICILR